MRKADKRRLGEKKANREAEERRQSGLEAQRIARMRETQKKEHEMVLERERKTPADRRTGTPVLNQRHRSALLNNGINPSTGLVFSDYDMAEMERKANTPERRHMFEQIRAGRAGTLNEQPPLGGIDDYVDPLPEMTVGDRLRQEEKDDRFPSRFMEMQEAMKLFTRSTEDTSAANEIYGMRRRGVSIDEKYSDGTSEDRMPRMTSE